MPDYLFIPMQDWRYPVSISHNSKRVIDPAHMHNFLQIFYINSGSCSHCAGDLTTTLRPNVISILPMNFPHYTDARYADNDLYLFDLSPRMFSAHSDSSPDFHSICLQPLSSTVRRKTPIIYPRAQTSDKVSSLLTETYAILHDFSDEKHLLVQGKSVELLSLIASEYASLEGRLNGSGNSDYCPSLYTAFNFIHSNYNDPSLSAEDAARAAMMSVRSFSRIFKASIGIPFIQYVQYLRILHAKKLLAETDRTLPDLCEEAGFNNLSNFHRSFRNQTGFTPREWRVFAQNKLCIYPQQLVL